MHTFTAIDQSKSFSIGPAELEAASQAYGKSIYGIHNKPC